MLGKLTPGNSIWAASTSWPVAMLMEKTWSLWHYKSMKPSIALEAHRDEILRIVASNRGLNPRVFGSVLHQEDSETSDLDLLIDPADGLSLFDMAAMALAIERLIDAKVDVKTPEDLSIKFRSTVLAEARPI